MQQCQHSMAVVEWQSINGFNGMKTTEKLPGSTSGPVVLRRHGFAWAIPGLLLLLAPLTYGASLLPAAFRAAQLWRARQWVDGTRVVMERGILFRTRRELELTAVEFVQVKPCLFGQAVDCGTIIVHGAGGVTLTLRQLAHPRSAQRAIQRALNAAPRCQGSVTPIRPRRGPIAA